MQETKSLGRAWAVCMIGALYFFYIFLQMMKFNAIGSDLMMDFHIGSTGLGALSSAYFWGNIVFLFVAGLMLGRFLTKKILAVVMWVVILCTFVFAFLKNQHTSFFAFFLIGIAGAFGLLIPLRLASRWFPSDKMALVSGLIVTIGFFGAMTSQSPLVWLVNQVGWRHAMIWDAGFGVLLFFLMMFVIQDFPEGVTNKMSREQATSWSFLWYSIKQAVINRQNWSFGLYTCLLNLPLFVFATFGLLYLQQVQHLSETQAAFMVVILYFGAMLGSPALGWISDKMQNRKMPMIVSGLISLALILGIMYWNNMSIATIYTLFFLLGFFTSAQVITYPVIAESNAEEIVGSGFGMGSTLIMSGGAILVPLFGWLLDLHWGGQVVHDIPIHTLAEYRFALWLLPISFIVGILAVMIGKETHGKRIV